MSHTVKLIGAPQSPYSRKMRAALRYRRIPFQWLRQGSPETQGQPDVKLKNMIPVVWLSHKNSTQDVALLDSTFQLQHLETMYSERSLTPIDPVVKFFDRLIEDFGDEWMTKCMFHYRWAREQDVKKAGVIIPLEVKWNWADDQIKEFQDTFADRQVGRLGYVGSNDVTAPVIEESYVNILQALNSILTKQPFLMGNRPGAADFGVFGQLVCLTQFDPTPSAVALEVSPRVYAWVEAMEDVSGDAVTDADWIKREDIKETWGSLLTEFGRTYAPYLLGNADAIRKGAEQVQCNIDGREWVQNPFPYQKKCLQWLQEEFSALNVDDQQYVRNILENTGCDILFD